MKYFKLASLKSMVMVATVGSHFLINLEAASANNVLFGEEATVSGDQNIEEFPIILFPKNKESKKSAEVPISAREGVNLSIEISTIFAEEWARLIASDTNHSFDDDWKDWRLTLWGGILSSADLSEILLFKIELADSYLIGLAANKGILALNKRVYLEGELQALKHFGDQNHLEFTLGIGLRWQLAEPVSVAFFNGFSLATETPQIEKERADQTNPLLNYFALEIEVSVAEDWALTGRIHHRSGAFGLFNGVRRGSNAYLLGVSHRF
ncbi:hypothetical protein PCC7418_2901 [Halothece sp. PCC 7418]|uniref:hypothetical protein n=1 Tax=Halothece sp. (strain PCC 7418) TaxID=65093 RepID=UPI0002A06379|nr:hypothetical protein [Halothece sp. PCC 7418]AFZ45031.1 hypothetical protein PCC7418_2901 [Halothece sp. PCC 7418]